MSVLLLAIGTTRSRAVCETSDFLLARGVEVGLVTVEPSQWQEAGLDPRVTIHALGAGEERHPLARLGKLVRGISGALYTKVYAKFYRLMRPYVMWRVARRSVVRKLDWTKVDQLVICDSHAIPIGWHLAKRHTGLTVGFELDRTPYNDREPAQSADEKKNTDTQQTNNSDSDDTAADVSAASTSSPARTPS